MPTLPRDRICLDVGSVRERPAGVALYAGLLAGGLARLAPDRLELIGVRAQASVLDAVTAVVPGRPFRFGTYQAWMQLAAPGDARASGVALAHYTNAAAPLLTRLPYVLTVHDLSLIRVPGSHPAARRLTVPLNLLAMARARAIVVPSAFTARELRRIGVSSRRVTVIPHAPTIAADAAPSNEAIERHGLAGAPYLLYVGTLEPRKNITGLVNAFERLAQGRPDLRLVLVGAPGWHYAGLDERISGSRFAERIVRPGYVAADELAGLIRGCAAFVYVSRYEGFGMPVLDAMALGAAVVTSHTSAMPQAAGGAAVLVDPGDPADIARGIDDALTRRAELAERSLRRAAGRTWNDVAADHLELYGWTIKRAAHGRQ